MFQCSTFSNLGDVGDELSYKFVTNPTKNRYCCCETVGNIKNVSPEVVPDKLKQKKYIKMFNRREVKRLQK